MLPILKIKCKKQYYQKDGSCNLLEKIGKKYLCLKHNCVYYEGENKNV